MGKIFIGLLICAAIFFVGCGSANKTVNSSSTAPASSISVSTQTSSAPEDYIKGLSSGDIIVNLEKWNIPKAKLQVNGSTISYQSEATDSDTGAQLSYYISGKNTTEITNVTFEALNTNGADASTFETLASSFLSYCATVPYDSANQNQASQWIKDNIANANNTGNPIETTIGDAQFQLSGNDSSARILKISKAIQ